MARVKRVRVPEVPLGSDNQEILRAMKHNLEIISGDVGGKIKLLDSNAGISEIIAKVNELIEKIQS